MDLRERRLAPLDAETREPRTAEKLEHHWASLALVERILAQHPLVEQLRFELEALAAPPPQPPDDGASVPASIYEHDPA